MIRFTPFPKKAQLISAEVLEANNRRCYLLIQNNSASDIYASFGVAASIQIGVKIVAGGYYEPFVAPNNSVHIVGSAANLSCMILEGVKVDG